MSVRNGVQVARKYQPVVANPQSPLQVAVRARLKMLSQLSAAYAPIIAIRRNGAVSARNIFTRANFPYSEFDGEKAVIPLADVLLTSSTSGLPGFAVTRAVGVGISVTLDEDASQAWERVVYVVVAKTASQVVIPISSTVVTDPGDNGQFPAVLPYSSSAIAVYAYGIRFNSSAARVYFDNLQAPTAQDYAQVLTSTRFNENDVALSETRGLYLEEGVTSGTTTGVRSVIITMSVRDSSGNPQPTWGSVTGSGAYPVGATVMTEALPYANYVFDYWYVSTDALNIGSENPRSFTAERSLRIYAIMKPAE